jgi:hypothetical protein
MTTTVTSAYDLLTDTDFIGFCRCWQRDKRCSLAFPDWLRERGLDRQAEVAEWAVRERARSDGYGPTPAQFDDGKWYWMAWHSANITVSQELRVRSEQHPMYHSEEVDTFEAAIAQLLDEYTPPEEQR